MRGSVVVYRPAGEPPPSEHELATQVAVARVLAEVLGREFAGAHDPARPPTGPVYFVPHDTLLACDAGRLGIRGPDDLFGGVVPLAFVKTKAITHRLTRRAASRPAGWLDHFTAAVGGSVLPGFTAFSRAEARLGVRRLLARGPVRIKPPLAAGGRGQRVVETVDEADAALAAFTDETLAAAGVVLETNLMEVVTFSIGRLGVAGRTVSYLGTQAETVDNAGRRVYGGSDLTVVRGGWTALDRLHLDRRDRAAIRCAVRYDRATLGIPGFFASRRNYDVAAGLDGGGRRCLGVLEASWRCGGASPAEVAALRALERDPTLQVVRASTVERYGADVALPGDALVHFRGDDEQAGPVVRYTRVAAA